MLQKLDIEIDPCHLILMMSKFDLLWTQEAVISRTLQDGYIGQICVVPFWGISFYQLMIYVIPVNGKRFSDCNYVSSSTFSRVNQLEAINEPALPSLTVPGHDSTLYLILQCPERS